MIRIYNYKIILVLNLFVVSNFIAQPINNLVIKKYVEQFKAGARGPYKDIRWFCKDGSTLPAKERCAEPGGVQRARYKDQVEELGKMNNVFLGQILSTTPNSDFWDEQNQNSRLKQYQLEKYLRMIDNGWILRRAQFYRGAFQAEDEKDWGIQFYQWLLANDDIIKQQYFLIRESIKDIPHQAETDKVQNIRSLSRIIADEYIPFMDLRVKIHGQPDSHDIINVKKFKENHKAKLTPELLKQFDELIADMEFVNKPVDLTILGNYFHKALGSSKLKMSIASFIKMHIQNKFTNENITMATNLIWSIRKEIQNEKQPKIRLALLDFSIKLEQIIFREIDHWKTTNVNDLLSKNYALCKATAGVGLLEEWEWEYIEKSITPPKSEIVNLGELTKYLDNSRRIVEWGTGTIRANYRDVVDLFSEFEPLSQGFLDDRVRSSELLPLGSLVDKLNKFVSSQASFTNQIMDIADNGSIRGINAGYAFGELVVISDYREGHNFSSDKIYIFDRPPADLKPVAGIATVTEGNIVSHVQLLARNLGIPNAILSHAMLEEFKKYSGKKVFYAVSNKGTVILKSEDKMTEVEKQLFVKKTRSEDRIEVPVDKLDLTKTHVVNLKKIRATDSGKLCGPKAANLGELKFLFPDKVVEGFVIPFAIFKQHLNQKMPGTSGSYWEFLNSTFKETELMKKNNIPQSEVDNFTLKKLEELRNAIKNISLLPELVTELENSFQNILGTPLGTIPVFIRSDTNMEDLKDFTGAGLNLTLFNVLEKDKFFQGIREVWASPYSERSYKWRQKYLLNPENVYPSLLIIPTVNVEKSGVMITKGLTTGSYNDVTIAFSRGAGGAVEGQIAETYLISSIGENILLSPSRETKFNVLPETGGSTFGISYFNNPILNKNELEKLRVLSGEIKTKLKSTETSSILGPKDSEMGFKDGKIWLFQIRPFVENKNASKSEYLDSIIPKFPSDKKVNLKTNVW